MSAPQRRPALILFVIIASGVCLALGYWQWTRFEATGGTAQNLGYALQWPLFAGFVVWAYFRFVRLEHHAELEQQAQAPEEPTPTPKRPKAATAREIPAGILPERPKAAKDDDPELSEYNKYLAGLHAHDMDEQIRAAGLRTNTERNAG
ncbi:transcriptional regulator [Nocardia sp. 2]|uniref:Transcriptional regulator n=1 Tax=Nocardia acididurans TaxID=2802282 RepID=A0ABS1MCZ5_9NOCA|nr:transcriptional regulator [Nocardia acididurans]MBL1078124.1 transcriptional regulator [Nocardia acididurans]